MDKEIDDILAHYGVKGMQWGVRQQRITRNALQAPSTRRRERIAVQQESRAAREAKFKKTLADRKAAKENKPTRSVSEDASLAKAAKAKSKKQGLDALSNKELQQLVNRMNLEQQYSRLTSHEGAVKTGLRAGKKVLGAGKTVSDVYNTVNSPAFKALNSALSKTSKK